MAQAVADVLAANMQTLRPVLPDLLEQTSSVYTMIQKAAEKFQITKTVEGYDFRIPFNDTAIGTFGAGSFNGVSLGSGTGFTVNQMYQSYFVTKLGIEITSEAQYTTENSNKSIANAWKKLMKDGMKSMSSYLDASFHNINSGYQGCVGLLTNYVQGSPTTTGTITLDPEFGANLLKKGMRVEFYTNNLGTQTTAALSPGSLPYISWVNKEAGTAGVAGLTGPISPATDGYVVFPQLGAATPPVWLNGLYYFHSTAASGALLGLERSTYTELLPNMVNAGGALSHAHGLSLKIKILQRRGEVPKLKGLIHPVQAAAVFNLGLSISRWNRGASDKMIDLMPVFTGDTAETVPFAGVDCRIDIHQSKYRVEYLNLDNWGRVYLKELDYYRSRSGQMIFEKRDGDGNVVTADQFFLTTAENFFCSDPGGEGMIYGISLPSLY